MSHWRLAHRQTITRKTIPDNIAKAEYAVRGEMVIRAEEIQQQIAAKPGEHGFAYDNVVMCNIGNPQALGQKPLSFPRQVLSLLTHPELLENPQASALFPADAMTRARRYLDGIPAGTGAYSTSQGVPIVRHEVAEFITNRDGHSCDPGDVFLTDGASPAVKMALNLLIRDASDGIMVPVPQYPLYSASVQLNGGAMCSYFLDESKGWGMDPAHLQAQLEQARSEGVQVRGLVVINPGNPTGQALPRAVMEEVVQLCERESLVLLADEVYQANVYGSTPFTSFKKVVRDMKSPIELFSFHSVSKGFLGECGRRGGYVEVVNVDPIVHEMIYKLVSVNLCSNVDGQVMVGLMTNPPKQGDPSYDLYTLERDNILDSLQRRAVMLADGLNAMEGVSCNQVEGALYAFPRVELPTKAVEAAQKAGKQPDLFYCLHLLEEAGVCVVPGSGFGQEEGTYHFRTTILPQEKHIANVVERMNHFHAEFLARYR